MAAEYVILKRNYAHNDDELSFKPTEHHPLDKVVVPQIVAAETGFSSSPTAALAAAVAESSTSAAEFGSPDPLGVRTTPVRAVGAVRSVAPDPLGVRAAPTDPLGVRPAADPLGVSTTATGIAPAAASPTFASSPLLPTSAPVSNAATGNGLATAAARRREDNDSAAVRARVLRDYKSDALIEIAAKIEKEGEEEKTDADKAREWLEKVEAANEAKEKKRERVRKVNGMTQKALVEHLDRLARDMELAWDRGEKVEALKIAIQTTRLILEPAQPTIFPYLAVLGHKFLDAFGLLVFSRILRRAINPHSKEESPSVGGRLPEEVPNSVPAQAREMCRNWLYKISCIRELGPRLYIELALLRCTIYFAPGRESIRRNALRLAEQCRGLSEPLVATYARMYVVHTVARVADPEITAEVAKVCWEDWLQIQAQWQGKGYFLGSWLKERGLSRGEYGLLHTPAVEVMVRAAGRGKGAESFPAVLRMWEERIRSRGALRALVLGYPAAAVAPCAQNVIAAAEAEKEDPVPMWRVHEALGPAVTEAPPAETKARLALLNAAWGEIGPPWGDIIG